MDRHQQIVQLMGSHFVTRAQFSTVYFEGRIKQPVNQCRSLAPDNSR